MNGCASHPFTLSPSKGSLGSCQVARDRFDELNANGHRVSIRVDSPEALDAPTQYLSMSKESVATCPARIACRRTEAGITDACAPSRTARPDGRQ